MKIAHMNIIEKQKGFSLLEILITVIIVAVGLLGLAALQITSLKANHGALQKTQATFLAYDIADRIRSNRNEGINGNYDISLADIKPTGSTLPETDLNDWLTSIANLLPSGDGAVDCANTGDCTITITWNISREGIVDASNNEVTLRTFTFATQI